MFCWLFSFGLAFVVGCVLLLCWCFDSCGCFWTVWWFVLYVLIVIVCIDVVVCNLTFDFTWVLLILWIYLLWCCFVVLVVEMCLFTLVVFVGACWLIVICYMLLIFVCLFWVLDVCAVIIFGYVTLFDCLRANCLRCTWWGFLLCFGLLYFSLTFFLLVSCVGCLCWVLCFGLVCSNSVCVLYICDWLMLVWILVICGLRSCVLVGLVVLFVSVSCDLLCLLFGVLLILFVDSFVMCTLLTYLLESLDRWVAVGCCLLLFAGCGLFVC